MQSHTKTVVETINESISTLTTPTIFVSDKDSVADMVLIMKNEPDVSINIVKWSDAVFSDGEMHFKHAEVHGTYKGKEYKIRIEYNNPVIAVKKKHTRISYWLVASGVLLIIGLAIHQMV
jgi:hypothetical protein